MGPCSILGYFSSWGPLLVWGPEQVAPALPSRRPCVDVDVDVDVDILIMDVDMDVDINVDVDVDMDTDTDNNNNNQFNKTILQYIH